MKILFGLQVLTEPKHALGKQYKKLVGMNEVSIYVCVFVRARTQCVWNFNLALQVKLHFTDKALRMIAKKAMAKNTGARGLRALIENILTDAMYEVLIWLSSIIKNCYQSLRVWYYLHTMLMCAPDSWY